MANEDFDMIDAVFCQLAERKERLGSQSITDIEEVVLLIWHASGVIGNGGFQYSLECGLPLREIAQAYHRIGVDQAALVLQKVWRLVFHGELPEDHGQRMRIISNLCEQHRPLLDRLEADYYSTDALMQRQLAGWIRVHEDVFGKSDMAKLKAE